ncbi:MAG: hypothetical protein ACREA4_13350 [Nitrososphaera sp.]
MATLESAGLWLVTALALLYPAQPVRAEALLLEQVAALSARVEALSSIEAVEGRQRLRRLRVDKRYRTLSRLCVPKSAKQILFVAKAQVTNDDDYAAFAVMKLHGTRGGKMRSALASSGGQNVAHGQAHHLPIQLTVLVYRPESHGRCYYLRIRSGSSQTVPPIRIDRGPFLFQAIVLSQHR